MGEKCALTHPHEPHIYLRGVGGVPGPVETTTHICPGVPDSTPTVREAGRYGFLSSDGYPEEGPNPLIKATVREAGDEGIAALRAELGPREADCRCCLVVDQVGLAGLLDRVEVAEAKVAQVEALAEWFDAQINWREWGIGRQIRAALAPETPEADKS